MATVSVREYIAIKHNDYEIFSTFVLLNAKDIGFNLCRHILKMFVDGVSIKESLFSYALEDEKKAAEVSTIVGGISVFYDQEKAPRTKSKGVISLKPAEPEAPLIVNETVFAQPLAKVTSGDTVIRKLVLACIYASGVDRDPAKKIKFVSVTVKGDVNERNGHDKELHTEGPV